MDEGLPIAYPVLEEGVPVYAADGTQVGTVDHVVAAPQEDIFHGLVIQTGSGARFVAADQVASLHERGADLTIGAEEVAGLPAPHGAALARHVTEPGVKPSGWRHFVDLLELRDPRRRDWSDEN
jgi:sporulation protein YlmC with PRC-barrel domain